MKKDSGIFLLAATLLFVGLLLGILIGRQMAQEPVQIQQVSNETQPNSTTGTIKQQTSDGKININTASAENLSLLPGIGEVLAQRIVEYRQTNGPFQDIWELNKVYGIGEKTIKEIQILIKVEDTQ